jgi:hypothetical protein
MNHVLLDIVKHLNHQFQITPILYGSFAVEKVLGQDLLAKDIDLLIPSHYFKDRQGIITYLLFQGYEYIQDEVIHLSKDRIDIELADETYWMKHALLDPKAFHQIQAETCTYQILGAKNLLNLYQYLVTLKDRSFEKKQNDLRKITLLHECINHHVCHFD